ncbi:hypothetical protein [Flavobacterium sp.]|uniref:hypothetical protein n=1 Tax=Flavobacterium sp. TaxID=239 RepID=UPI004047430D
MIQDEIKKVLNNKYGSSRAHKEKLLQVLYLTEELLVKYKIPDTQFFFANHFNAIGIAYSDNRISLLIEEALKTSIEDFKNTILHEIAHILVGVENGHNIIWQKKAIELGVTWNINYRK